MDLRSSPKPKNNNPDLVYTVLQFSMLQYCSFLTLNPTHTYQSWLIFSEPVSVFKHITLTFGKFEELKFLLAADQKLEWQRALWHDDRSLTPHPTPVHQVCILWVSKQAQGMKKQTDGEINACWLAVCCVFIRGTRPYQEENVNLTCPFAGNNGAHWFEAKETERANWLIFFRLCTELQIRH